MLRLALIGLVAGFLSALFGVGGGILIVPLLLLVAHFGAREATATSLGAIGITALAGVVGYSLTGRIHVVDAALVGIPAALGATLGATVQQRLPVRTLSYLFALLLVGVAITLFLQ